MHGASAVDLSVREGQSRSHRPPSTQTRCSHQQRTTDGTSRPTQPPPGATALPMAIHSPPPAAHPCPQLTQCVLLAPLKKKWWHVPLSQNAFVFIIPLFSKSRFRDSTGLCGQACRSGGVGRLLARGDRLVLALARLREHMPWARAARVRNTRSEVSPSCRSTV